MKNLLFIEAPVETVSGYGKHSYDIVNTLFNLFPESEWDILIASTRWGETPKNALKPEIPEHQRVLSKIFKGNKLPKQPDVHIQITIPSEFRPLGRYSIGITAGTESSLASVKFIEGCNNMNLVIVPSKHTKFVFETTQWNKINSETQQQEGYIKIERPIEILFEGIDTKIYKKTKSNNNDLEICKTINSIPESFAFLFVGHWLKGDLGQDRKDVGMLIKTFLETFKNLEHGPALILKASSSTFSLIDRESILERIEEVKKTIVASKLPKIYLLHGDLTDDEMNELYNHSKIKTMISFTKGEGFGRPLLEFSASGKPIMVPNWSGQLDFLPPGNAVLLKGSLTDIHPSAVWDDVLIKESKWFTVDYEAAAKKMQAIYSEYGQYLELGKKQANNASKNFSLEKMEEKFKTILDKYLPTFPKMGEIKIPSLPKLKVIGKDNQDLKNLNL